MTAKGLRKMDWGRVENRIRDVLQAYNDKPDPSRAANYLFEISEILGDETGRGYEIEQSKIPLWNKGEGD